jgi:hypothetical protein
MMVMNNANHQPQIVRIWDQIKIGLLNLVKEPAFYIYLISVVIYLPWFLPTLSEIAPWDETYFIVSGRGLVSGDWPVLGYGPLLSVVAAISYLPFRGSHFWLIHANSLSRFLLFSFVFVGAWQAAKALRDHFNPMVLFGFLFLTPLLTYNFEYPADLLFAPISAIAFAQGVYFIQTRAIKHVWWASFWLGLGMLTRGDALILVIAFSVFVLIFGWRQHKWWQLLLAAVIPFVAFSVGYVLLRGVFTGDFNTAMAERSYTAFEQGQEMDMPAEEGRFAAPTESYYVARELFGTPEENEYSVFRAIARNPEAYLRRLVNVSRSLPGLFLTAYYRRYAIFIAALVLRGLVALIQQKKVPLAILHLVWVLPLSAGIARTLVRVGYFRLFFFVVLSLAAIGLKALLDSLKTSREGWFWVGGMGLVLVLALIQGDDSIQFGMAVLICWLLLAFLLSQRSERLANWEFMAMLLLLGAGFMLRGGFLIYSPRELSDQPRERASLALREVTEPDDYVLTCTPSVVFLAERQVANFCSSDIPEFDSSEDFIIWMEAQDFYAIYLDSASPGVLIDMVQDQKGKALRQTFGTETGEASIFVINRAN